MSGAWAPMTRRAGRMLHSWVNCYVGLGGVSEREKKGQETEESETDSSYSPLPFPSHGEAASKNFFLYKVLSKKSSWTNERIV